VIDRELQDRLAGQLLDRDILTPRNQLHKHSYLFGFAFKQVQIVTEQLDADIGADAGDHFVDAHLDRLREYPVLPRKIRQLGINLRNQLLLIRSALPFIAGFERHEHIREFESHRIGRQLRGPHSRPYVRYHVGECLEQMLLDAGVVGD